MVTSDHDLIAIIWLNYWFRRDSFITHRAFCDALAQESARHPPSLSTIGSNLYGNNNSTGLGLSQVGPQLSSIQDQNNQSGGSNVLRLGGAGGARVGQFDHLLGSSFRPPQQASAMPSSAAFFLPSEGNQQFLEEHQSPQGLLPNKPYHGLMQFSDLQTNTNSNNNPPPGSSLFSLPFLSNSSTNSSMNNNNNNNPSTNTSGLLISNHFNHENRSSTDVGSNIFAGQIMGEHLSSGVPSLYSTSVQNNHSVTHMSATALLQKAAQMGSSTSNNSNNNTASLLRTFGTSPSTSSKPIVPGSFGSIFGENENHLQDLMNSFAAGGGSSSSIFAGGSGGLNAFGGIEQEPKTSTLHRNLSSVSMGASDRLTRDFLGVGEIVRSMGGGFSPRDHQNNHPQQQSLEMAGSMDSEGNAAPSSQSFGGGGGNFQWR